MTNKLHRNSYKPADSVNNEKEQNKWIEAKRCTSNTSSIGLQADTHFRDKKHIWLYHLIQITANTISTAWDIQKKLKNRWWNSKCILIISFNATQGTDKATVVLLVCEEIQRAFTNFYTSCQILSDSKLQSNRAWFSNSGRFST